MSPQITLKNYMTITDEQISEKIANILKESINAQVRLFFKLLKAVKPVLNLGLVFFRYYQHQRMQDCK